MRISFIFFEHHLHTALGFFNLMGRELGAGRVESNTQFTRMVADPHGCNAHLVDSIGHCSAAIGNMSTGTDINRHACRGREFKRLEDVNRCIGDDFHAIFQRYDVEDGNRLVAC